MPAHLTPTNSWDAVHDEREPFITAEHVALARALFVAEMTELEYRLPAVDDPMRAFEVDLAGVRVLDADELAIEAVQDAHPDLFDVGLVDEGLDDSDRFNVARRDGAGRETGAPHADRASGWRVVDDESRVASLSGPAYADELAVLAGIDPARLSHQLDRVAYLQRVERLEALVASMKAGAIVALVGEAASVSSLDEAHVALEVALARRVGPGAASSSIEVARALATTFADFGTALAAGEVSEWHCRELVTATRAVSDEGVLSQIAARTLPKAKRMTPREFAREVTRAVVSLDTDCAARMDRAREDRRVWCRPLPDGMGFLGLVHDWPTVHAIHASITADGRALQLQRGGARAVRAGDDDATADASRADAMATRVLGKVCEDGSITWDRSEQVVTLNLVMDLDTVRNEADGLALLDGEPLPANVAREWLDGAALWRRVVTAPATGVLLDYGTEQYLPDTVRRFILARDGTCRTPVCPRTRRLQMDHSLPFPDGPTSAANCRALCPTCHPLKTAGHLRIAESQPDGSATLSTRWGQTFRIPSRPFLHDPADDATTAGTAREEGTAEEAPARPSEVPAPDDEPPPL